MRRYLLVAVLCCAACGGSGCSLFETETVKLDKEAVAQLEAKIGEYNAANRLVWEETLARELGGAVAHIEELNKGMLVTLEAPMEEAGKAAGTTLLKSVAEDPSSSGIIAGIPFAVFAFLSVMARRLRRKGKK